MMDKTKNKPCVKIELVNIRTETGKAKSLERALKQFEDELERMGIPVVFDSNEFEKYSKIKNLANFPKITRKVACKILFDKS